nr:MAG TPA: hypothetical protein [Caudoviricetes sp.]
MLGDYNLSRFNFVLSFIILLSKLLGDYNLVLLFYYSIKLYYYRNC